MPDQPNAAAIRVLAERLAPAVHDAWAARRTADGWRYGPERSDARKEHPALVSWEALSEEEREYDRTTAETVLRALAGEGWTLQPPASSHAAAAAPERLREDTIADRIARWRWNAGAGNATSPPLALADAAIEAGEALLACDLLEDARVRFPANRELVERHALALARVGATARARALLEGLHREGHRTANTVGLLARTFKDAALEARDATARRASFEQAHRLYLEAHGLDGGAWSAINAASMAAAAGDLAAARGLATKARDAASSSGDADDYWRPATLAEAALLLGEREKAATLYREAMRLAKQSWGSIASMRRNARLLLSPLGIDASFLSGLPVPRIVSLSPDADLAPLDALARGGIGAAFLVPASEREIALGEAASSRGVELQLVLPCDADDLLAGMAPALRQRLAALLGSASGVRSVSKTRVGGAVSDDYARSVARGLAHLRAAQLETEVVSLGSSPARARGEGEPAVRSFLFCDTVGYSKLADAEVALYIRHFLRAIGELLGAIRPAPLAQNTWGDAVYIAFESPVQAARFAMTLREKVALADWTVHGLPEGLTLRIALHAGPAFDTTDPVTGAANVFGAHVSRAARIEPVTPPGEVYASEAFAALAAEACPELAFEYVGQLPLAKGYGTFPTCHVRPRNVL